ncbi:MAG: KH domain-containing protein [Ruminococcaceae bacterium]|nr:KH domain-containing protein [Oscillospiraceae bacterium]
MADLKTTLHDIAAAIVDSPDEVNVECTETDTSIELVLSVAPDDMGMVIGRHGRIAKAIRTVIKAAATPSGKKVNVEIR